MMKRACRLILMCSMCWLLPTAAAASPCAIGSLSSYVTLGAGGCTVGTALFSNFADLPRQPGSAAIPDTSVFVNPVTTVGLPGFVFTVNSNAGAGSFFERVIGFTLSGPGFIGDRLTLTGSSASGDGGVTVVEKGCLGAAFGAGQFCSGIDTQLGGYDLGPILGQQLSDSQSFASKALLGVILDITVDGGTLGGPGGFSELGTAGLVSATTQFTQQAAAAVPEPATLTLLGLGLTAVIGGQRLRNRKRPRR